MVRTKIMGDLCPKRLKMYALSDPPAIYIYIYINQDFRIPVKQPSIISSLSILDGLDGCCTTHCTDGVCKFEISRPLTLRRIVKGDKFVKVFQKKRDASPSLFVWFKRLED